MSALSKRKWRKWKKKYLGLGKHEEPESQTLWMAAAAGVLKFEWITQNDDEVCIDCKSITIQQPKEGGTWEEWWQFGFPRAGHTICLDECRCTVSPLMIEGAIAGEDENDYSLKQRRILAMRKAYEDKTGEMDDIHPGGLSNSEFENQIKDRLIREGIYEKFEHDHEQQSWRIKSRIAVIKNSNLEYDTRQLYGLSNDEREIKLHAVIEKYDMFWDETGEFLDVDGALTPLGIRLMLMRDACNNAGFDISKLGLSDLRPAEMEKRIKQILKDAGVAWNTVGLPEGDR